MKSLQILFFVATLMALVIADSATLPHKEESPFLTYNVKNHNSTENPATPSSESEELASLRGTKGLHGHKNVHRAMTCDKYPRVCHAKGSEGPDCCRRKCVNVSTDRNNCGACGKRCKYSQVCCRGKCVNLMFDKYHCGRCGNKCNKGDSCIYAMREMNHKGNYSERMPIIN
ncbi:Stigma-specific STIG1-like protein 1, partial [Mucuna pruriens]